MITLKHITKSFEGKIVLNNVSVTFVPGKLYVIKGVSGSGKTTLLNIISCLDVADQGTYCYDGEPVQGKQAMAMRKRIGYMFQQSLLIAHLSVKENLLLIQEEETKIEHYAQKFHVSSLLNQMPSTLSGGERQRIALIRSLLCGSEILIADEPTASLDKKTSKDIAETIASLRFSQKMILVATHEDCFDEFADEILIMEDGDLQQSKQTISQIKEPSPQIQQKKHPWKYDWKYAKAKNHHLPRGIHLCLVVLLMIFFLICGFALHAKEAFETKMITRYPYRILIMNEDQYMELPWKEQLQKQEMRSGMLDGIQLRTWLPETDSTFAIQGVIAYGDHPKEQQEILVNSAALAFLYPEIQLEDGVGKQITVKGENLMITGILSEDPSMLNEAFYAIPSYSSLNAKTPMIFLSTTMMESFHFPCVLQEQVYLAPMLDEEQYRIGTNPFLKYAPYAHRIQDQLDGIKAMQAYVSGGTIVVFCLAFLFLSNLIFMDVSYRKREFGYLQLFQISKFRIYRMVFFEMIQKILSAIALAGIITYVFFWFLWKFFDLNLCLLPQEFLPIIMIVLFYVWMLVLYPMHKMLKTSIIKLIK